MNTESVFRKTDTSFVFSFKNLAECNNIGTDLFVVKEKELSVLQKKYLLIPVFHESNHESEINLNLKLKSSEDLSRLHKKMGHNKAKVVNNMLKASGAENNILEEYKKMYACWIYCPNYQTSPCRRKSPWVQAFGMNDVWRMDVFYLNI